MGKEYSVQEALKLAVQAEKDSMDFYRRASTVTGNKRAKRVFEQLANEEVGHLKAFFDLYKGGEFGSDLKKYMETPPVRGIFTRVIKETQKHYDMIEEEYRHVMTMVHESDQNIYVRE
jgi:erythrin-vacuolar iron transport family protein